jgi:hypothetical protein
MRSILILIFFSAFGFFKAQDKLIFKTGKKVNCKVLSIDASTVSYSDSVSTQKTAAKKDLIMAEKNGAVFIFGASENSFPTYSTSSDKPFDYNESRAKARKEKEKTFSNNIIGIQIPDLVFGRLTMTYERLFNEKQIGITIPASLSYDPRILFSGLQDTASVRQNPIRTNVGFITGLDINYYFARKSYSKFFVGPRLRYGTDVYLQNLTGYSVQLQNGFLACSSNGKMASTFAFGVGFVRVTSFNGIDPRQSFPWMSVTIRIGFRA